MNKDSKPDFGSSSCPLPIDDYQNIIMGHGGGGRLTSELIERVFLPAFNNAELAQLQDSTVLNLDGGRYAFSTDSYVIQPLFFPGGNIGELAVYGTVNDLAMSGAQTKYLSVGFVLEEGLSIELLQRIANSMGLAAARVGVSIVTGDTKVVERGRGDGIYINTTGIGKVANGIDLGSHQVQPGDAVLISGTIGDHGMAVMSVREGLEFESSISSDLAPLHELAATVLAACPNARMFRDPTRGGLASTLNEIAMACKLGIEIVEEQIPVSPIVQSACEILGLNPLEVANEGKMVVIVSAAEREQALGAMRGHALGGNAAVIGEVVPLHPGLVTIKSRLGSMRVVPQPMGELLPRIC